MVTALNSGSSGLRSSPGLGAALCSWARQCSASPYEHSSLVTGIKLFEENSFPFATRRSKWHNFILYVFPL